MADDIAELAADLAAAAENARRAERDREKAATAAGNALLDHAKKNTPATLAALNKADADLEQAKKDAKLFRKRLNAAAERLLRRMAETFASISKAIRALAQEPDAKPRARGGRR